MGRGKPRSLPAPFLTCEPVLTETYFLASPLPGGPLRFFELLHSGMLEVDFSVLAERETLWKLIRKYEDLPMSLIRGESGLRSYDRGYATTTAESAAFEWPVPLNPRERY